MSILINLKEEAIKRGDRLGAVSTGRLMDVKADFDNIGVDTEPYYNFTPPEDLGFTARTVLIVASPSPAMEASFDVGGEIKRYVIPPFYVNESMRFDETLKYIRDTLRDTGYSAAIARSLPCKALAVHAGIAAYGRNNIAYAEGMGSFCGLILLYTDCPCDGEPFYQLHFADRCENCGLCADSCPTGAIRHGVDQIDANRCITMFNESDGEFPDWIDPSWHNALVGCMRCQSICPMNLGYMENIKEITSFSREETDMILKGILPDIELSRLGIADYFRQKLPRNLAALIKNGN